MWSAIFFSIYPPKIISSKTFYILIWCGPQWLNWVTNDLQVIIVIIYALMYMLKFIPVQKYLQKLLNRSNYN